MKILVPTDFSELSKIAVKYALGLSKDFELEMVLLHVISTNMPNMALLSAKKLEDSIKRSSELQMNQLLEDLKKEHGRDLKISAQVVYGESIQNAVEAYASKLDVDVICIGTKGATGLKKMLFGSNAAAMVAKSKKPVLTIPEYAVYSGINNIVYPSDLENLDHEVSLLTPFAKRMNAWLHILHIDDDDDHNEVLVDREVKLKNSLSYDRVKTKTLENNSIMKGINHYVTDVDADMLAMFTRDTSLFDKLFHKSLTKIAAFQAKTPLLTFQKV